jgi:hypothetical protein
VVSPVLCAPARSGRCRSVSFTNPFTNPGRRAGLRNRSISIVIQGDGQRCTDEAGCERSNLNEKTEAKSMHQTLVSKQRSGSRRIYSPQVGDSSGRNNQIPWRSMV